MFDCKQTLTARKQTLSGRLTDTVDLVIDFATLGEYGLEPVGPTPPRPCETRHRPTPPLGPVARRRAAEGPFLLRP